MRRAETIPKDVKTWVIDTVRRLFLETTGADKPLERDDPAGPGLADPVPPGWGPYPEEPDDTDPDAFFNDAVELVEDYLGELLEEGASPEARAASSWREANRRAWQELFDAAITEGIEAYHAWTEDQFYFDQERGGIPLWHVTNLDAAIDIMDNGFRTGDELGIETARRGAGVSLGVNPYSAATLLRQGQWMQSITGFDDVFAYFEARGADPAQLRAAYVQDKERLEQLYPGDEASQAQHLIFHLFCTAELSERDEVCDFMWYDLFAKHIGAGPMVAILVTTDLTYSETQQLGLRHRFVPELASGTHHIEAEWAVPAGLLHRLTPIDIVTDPDVIEEMGAHLL